MEKILSNSTAGVPESIALELIPLAALFEALYFALLTRCCSQGTYFLNFSQFKLFLQAFWQPAAHCYELNGLGGNTGKAVDHGYQEIQHFYVISILNSQILV